MYTYTHSHIFYLTKKKESRSQQGYPTLPRARELTQIGVKDPESYLLSLFFCSALFFFFWSASFLPLQQPLKQQQAPLILPEDTTEYSFKSNSL